MHSNIEVFLSILMQYATQYVVVCVYSIVKICVIFFVGMYAIRFIRVKLLSFFSDKLSHHTRALLSNAIYYCGISLCAIIALQSIGFDLSALLGAAGVIGIALGFAAKTSVSNIISGIFLLFEHSFSVGDTIKYQKITGVVQSIDLFSVKVRTFDNQLIRIPNEVILKEKITNVTYFDTRRVEIILHVFGQQDILVVKQIIEKTIAQTEHLLQTPKPVIVFKSVIQKVYVNEKCVVLLVRFWAEQKYVFRTTTMFAENLKNSFDLENISATIE